MLTSNQIREKFLQFFESKGHTRVKSASLIPQNDPTLYFTNAGMVPFKSFFTGDEKPAFQRAISSQKCMRVSGKHNDLENVGRTARHHTFFEMLGNFSFGDYFKKEAIALAWEFLTDVVKIPKDRLWITVFENDDEAFAIWEKDQHIPNERILRLGEKDNFWSMGETGPCGPCSEIHYQFDSCSVLDKTNVKDWFLKNSDAGDIIEIWNLVFMQFEQQAGGKRITLPKPSIDTGMGLERLASVLQGVKTNYDTDLFAALLKDIQKITRKTYGHDAEDDFSMRVLADHIRSTAFLIADGVLPSNEGRGYVLRRILRRAIRHGKRLGQMQPFFYKIVKTLVGEMGAVYAELKANQSTIEKIIQGEEERFLETLDKGLKILNDEMAQSKNTILNGDVAFKLYDTYGFPLDLTEMIAAENGLTVDNKGFDAAMQRQKERARAHWKGTDQEKITDLYRQTGEKFQTAFLGYGALTASAKVLALIQNGGLVTQITDGTGEMIVDQTPFYAESGGQVGDQGDWQTGGAQGRVVDTQKPVDKIFTHAIEITQGALKVGDTVTLNVARDRRRATMRNHSATHLLHAALRKILGAHVRQAGSLVNDKLLRFDFAHFEALAPATLRRLEDEVNAAILNNLPVAKAEMPFDDAIAAGALAFFGDKYGDTVRVIKMGDYSVELCGGTHLEQTAEIGLFKILSESSIAAGVRRIEAITGEAVLQHIQNQNAILTNLSAQLKTAPQDLGTRVEKMTATLKNLESEIDKLKNQLLRGNAQDYLKSSWPLGDTKAVYYYAKMDSAKNLQEIGQIILEKLGSGVAIVGAEIDGKASLLVMASQDVAARYPAQKILAPLAEKIGGRGGGKPERAQAGGDTVAGLAVIAAELPVLLKALA